MNPTQDIQFNIYNPVITYEHRAAYDMIVSQLQEIFPICNQGKCKALEVTDDPQKQKQINDLMEKVEYFSDSLINITKVFFDQLYRAKEGSSESISHSMAKIKIDMMERSLLERTCDVRWWALEKAFWECIELSNASQGKEAKSKAGAKATANDICQQAVNLACSRLEDIRSSYTLYRDLVIVNAQGIVVANSNVERKHLVVGLDVSDESWFLRGLQTKDGTDYHVQDVASSKLEDLASLIYATAIRARGDENGEVIGVMGVLFDFQGECQIILNDYLPKAPNGDILDGWFSFFTNIHGHVICSSDQHFIPFGASPELPRSHRHLNKPGESHVSTGIFFGNRSLLVSYHSAGFNEYGGLGWTSHLVLPIHAIFERVTESKVFGITPKELMSSSLIPAQNRQTYQESQRNTGDIQLISINGIVLATDLGKAGKSFMPIFDQITETGSSTTGKMELLLSEMSADMLQQNLLALTNLSQQAIELIDRNLFERAADVRWWSTDHALWECLQAKDRKYLDVITKRLQIINASYTMYRDLVVADASGRIVANSKAENRDRLSGMSVADQYWYRQGMQMSKMVQFAAQDVCETELENENTSLIYCSAILENGQRSGKPVGVLGILFDWENQAQPILAACLPRINNEVVHGGAAFYVNRDRVVIATTDESNFPISQLVNIPGENVNLKDGQTASGLFSANGRKYIIGSSGSHGYREYKGLGWTAHVVRAID